MDFSVGIDTFFNPLTLWITETRKKGLCVVARIFFLLMLNCYAWLCLGPA